MQTEEFLRRFENNQGFLIKIGSHIRVGFIRGDLYFVDGSLLIREFVNVKTEIERGKYTYQYMGISNNLIFRYDNAPRHQELNLPKIIF